MPAYYSIEDGKVVSFTYGTDIPGDPSGTKQSLEAWALQKPGRSIVEKPRSLKVHPKFLKVQNDDVVPMTDKEKTDLIADEKAAKEALEALEASAFEKIASASGLSEDEKEAYKSRVADKKAKEL